jgi:hypothetical protein
VKSSALSKEDELVLLETARADAFSYQDLDRLQVGLAPKSGSAGVPARTARNRHQFAASRQPHLCPYCRQILRTKWSLKQHICIRHFRIKSAVCNYCEKSYGSEADLRRHVTQVHEEPERRVGCQLCGEEVRAAYLKRHMQYRHHKQQQQPANCQECGKLFSKRETMLKHVRVVHHRK